MNLIINIDDEHVISDIKNHCLVAQSKTDTVIIDALYNGIPLEDIKAEIKSMDFDFSDFYDHTDRIIEMVCEVIDKYRKEPTDV